MKSHKPLAALLVCLFLSLLFLPACEQAAPREAGNVGQTIDFLTDPKLLGRAVGTEGNVKAGEYLARQLESMGIEPFFAEYARPYTQIVYDPQLAAPRLVITWPDGKEEALAFDQEYSMNLARGEIDAALTVTADPSQSNPAQYALLGDGLPISQLMEGGFGLVLKQWDSSKIEIHKSRDQAPGETAYRNIDLHPDVYKRLEAEGGVLRLTCANGRKEISADNILGRIRGADSSRAFIVSAHFDGAGGSRERFSTGAVDNASGVAAMLRCAALLAQGDPPPVDVVFCAFNGEETALQGSAAIAGTIEEAYNQCINVNIDCVGQIGALVYSLCDSEEEYDTSPLVADITARMDRLGLKHTRGPYSSSDHRSFACPSLAIGGMGGMELVHTTNDTPEQLDLNEIERVGQVVAQFITQYAGEFSWNIQAADSADFAEEVQDTYLPAALAKIEEIRELADTLAYDEAYQFALNEEVYVRITGMRILTSAAECAEFFPGIVLPQQVGNFTFRGALILDGRDTTVDGPDIFTSQPSAPLDQVYSLELTPRVVNAVYESADGAALQLLVQADSGNTDYNSPPYVKQETGAEEGDLYLLVWEGQAIRAVCPRQEMVYSLALLGDEKLPETIEEYSGIASQPADGDWLAEQAEAFDLFSLNIAFNP